MHCPTLQELPPPPAGKTGWPWTEETPQVPIGPPPEGVAWPKVSISTPLLNQGEFIEKSIRSVLLQGYPDLEYIIIDGGSTDRSVEVIREYEKWLTYWVSEPDRGTSDAVNKGFAHATGDVFGIMLGDDLYCPGALFTLAQLRAAHPNSVGWVGACPQFDSGGKVIYAGVPFIRAPETIGDFGSSAYLGCPGCLFDAESFRRTGGLDERFKNANDVELWVRLSKLGSFITTDKVVANIRYIESSDGNRDPLAGIAALIALNYIHGYPGVSKTILARYADRHAAVMSMDRGALAKAIARRTIGGFKRRLVRALRGFKGNR